MSDLLTQEFNCREALDTQLAENVALILATAIIERGKALLVVSGGSTPLHFFRLLSKKNIVWSKVIVTLADERWLAPDHCDSNEKLVKESLLINHAKIARFLALKNSANNAVEGEVLCDQQLAKLETFDVVILGMGADGHTASLFPKSSSLPIALDMDSGKQCIGVDPVTAPHQRMSMTLPRLLNTRQLFIHITGAEKKAVINKVIAQAGQCKLPIGALLEQKLAPVVLYWSS